MKKSLMGWLPVHRDQLRAKRLVTSIGELYISTYCDWCVDHVTIGGSDRRIPLLREVYEQFPNIPINIDIKVNNNELIRKVCRQ